MSPPNMPDRVASGPDLVLRYADGSDGVIDLFLPDPPSQRPAPLIVFLHGGFWRQQWDRTHLRPLASDLASRGWAVATPEFRRVGGAGGWPIIGLDVMSALTQVRQLVEQAAPGVVHPLVPVTLAGHSAGGHLALWSASRLPPATVGGVVALAPILDLAAAARVRLDGGAVQDLLGGEPTDVPATYADADPLARLRVDSGRLAVIAGDHDQRVPIEHTHEALTRSDDLGSRIDWVELAGVDHFALIDPTSTAWPVVLQWLDRAAGRAREDPLVG
jgi:acetyl esterase/lipase